MFRTFCQSQIPLSFVYTILLGCTEGKNTARHPAFHKLSNWPHIKKKSDLVFLQEALITIVVERDNDERESKSTTFKNIIIHTTSEHLVIFPVVLNISARYFGV